MSIHQQTPGVDLYLTVSGQKLIAGGETEDILSKGYGNIELKEMGDDLR